MPNNPLRPTTHNRFRGTLLVWVVLALSAAACSRVSEPSTPDPEPGTPEAAAEGERLMRQMSDTLAKLPAFRFTTNESLEQIGSPAEAEPLRFSRTITPVTWGGIRA